MILLPDSTSSRLWSRWRAPAKVVNMKSGRSYVVEIDDKRMHVHANFLHPYYVRVNDLMRESANLVNFYAADMLNVETCSVIFEKDEDFIWST